MQVAYCDAIHKYNPDRKRVAVEGLRLCEGCRVGVCKNLEDLPELWTGLRSGITRSIGGLGRTDPLVSGTRAVGLVYDGAALNCAEQMERDLAYFCRVILGQPGASVNVACTRLRREADRVCGHEMAPNVRDVLRSLVGNAYAILDPEGRPKEVGPCHEIAMWGGVCSGTLVMRGSGAKAELSCEVCGVRVPPRQWKRYGEAYKRAMLDTAEDVAVEGDVL